MWKMENPAYKQSKKQSDKEISILCKSDKWGLYMDRGPTRIPKPDPWLFHTS